MGLIISTYLTFQKDKLSSEIRNCIIHIIYVFNTDVKFEIYPE